MTPDPDYGEEIARKIDLYEKREQQKVEYFHLMNTRHQAVLAVDEEIEKAVLAIAATHNDHGRVDQHELESLMRLYDLRDRIEADMRKLQEKHND